MVREFYKSKVGNKNISENFKYKEFACKDGTDKFLIDTDLIPIIQKFREFVERPVSINSAYRTESYNKKIGGAIGSNHIKGKALDIPFLYDYKNLNNSIINMGAFFNTLKLKGIIKYGWGYHIDIRDYIYHATNTGKHLELGKIQSINFKTVRKGSKNNDVGVLQFMLKQIGYDIKVDCIFGSETDFTVRHYQDTHRLSIDGIVGARTWKKLLEN